MIVKPRKITYYGNVSMKDLIWDESLSVQVDEIDEDHRRLIDLFNILSHAVAENDQQAYIEAVLEELISCTIWHFKHEERLMIKYDYDDYTEHKADHDALIDSVRELQKNFLQVGKLSDEDISFLERWLTGHILSADMKLGAFLGEII